MFFVTAKTNVGYTPVADFAVQSETGIQIEEALQDEILTENQSISW